MIEKISHITFIVKDIEKSTFFFEHIFQAKEVYSSGENYHSHYREKFFKIGELWIALMESDQHPLPKTYNHIAFKVALSDLPNYHQRILQAGGQLDEGRSRIEGEGASLYFYDDDMHLFELHTGTLEERLVAYDKRNNCRL